MTHKLKIIFPFIFLFALFGLLWRELFYAKPHEIPSALIGEPVPAFSLENVFAPIKFTQKNLMGQVALLNVFATWCYACGVEQPMLMQIKNEYHIPIYGIDYKDKKEDAKKWLDENGNPYVLIGNDYNGDVAIDLGVYGTPETFVLNKQGEIVYRHIGVIDQAAWDKVIYPLIKKLQG